MIEGSQHEVFLSFFQPDPLGIAYLFGHILFGLYVKGVFNSSFNLFYFNFAKFNQHGLLIKSTSPINY